MSVSISGSGSALSFCYTFTINNIVDGTILEFCDVSGEVTGLTGLVGEDVFDLAEVV